MDEFFEDKTITCRDCQSPFVFTGGEQRFFQERQFTEPNRCKPCRAAKKAAREQGGGSQGYSSPTPAPQAAAPSFDSPPRRSFVYEPSQDPAADRPDGAPSGRKRHSGGGKRRRGDDSGWNGGD